MKKLRLLIAASIRSQVREAKNHLYAWLILTPMVLGITYASASRLVETVSPGEVSFKLLWLIGALFCLSLTGFTLSRATAEIYHLRRPESYFEALPLETDAHFYLALLTRLLRNGVAGLAIASLKVLLHERISLLAVLSLLCFVLLMTTIEITAALCFVHWQAQKPVWFMFGAMFVILPATALGGAAVASVLQPEAVNYPLLLPASLLAAVALGFAAHRMHRKWRAADSEHAKRLESRTRFSVFQVDKLRRRFNSSVAAQLSRDLQLTLRGFSSTVYVAAVIVLVLLVALFALLKSNLFAPAGEQPGWFDTARSSQIYAVKIACALVTTSLAVLTPVLIAYELPHLWLERTTETSGLDLWQAKLYYTRIVTSPAPFLAFLAGTITGRLPAFYLPLLFAECLLIWWALSSLIGAFAFEMPARTGLAVILMVTIGTAGGLAAAFGLLTSALLPFGALAYSQAMHGLTEKGRTRARYLLLIGED